LPNSLVKSRVHFKRTETIVNDDPRLWS